jgi:hypothetical protein
MQMSEQTHLIALDTNGHPKPDYEIIEVVGVFLGACSIKCNTNWLTK